LLSQELCAKPCPLISTVMRHSFLGVLTVAVFALGNVGCEDKAIGRPCDLPTDGGPSQAAYKTPAIECPSHVCIKPARAAGAAGAGDTQALCTAPCSQDSDCGGQTRDKGSPSDKRCSSGFVCMVPFEQGPICCNRYCVCKDFLPADRVIAPSALCSGPTATSCNSSVDGSS
jgi:hypothetical protein